MTRTPPTPIKPAIPYRQTVEVCSVKEAAALLGVSEDTVLKLISSGQVVARKVRRQWRIKREMVEALLPSAAPPIPAVEQALALLDDLTPDENLRVSARAIERARAGLRTTERQHVA